ncbi:cell division protein ZapA [Roseateles toxinivorans]|uniref:Cell division protein ZapA n=1 Tax=Roseateles toxinivorans TaxID=270368 RepID=A0A4V3CU14_9BURK|nr:cell division protein ZapA [Roseateles toxinivorans]TDP74858.1 cell division protein ZapA [Roseateles toxinivorans]
MKQMEVTIMGQGYVLGCPEGGEVALQKAVASVDQEMSAIRDAGRVKARERIAVLAALNLAYQLVERPEASQSPTVAAVGNAASELPELEELIRRVDEALGHDGQLL